MEQVPLVQKDIIRRSLAKHWPVSYHQMMSTITNITPTRAEVNDVANAADHADAVMLSAETSVANSRWRW